MRGREDANRTREAGHLDEIHGVVANTLRLYRKKAVGFIDWLGVRSVFGESFVNDCIKINTVLKMMMLKHPFALKPCLLQYAL